MSPMLYDGERRDSRLAFDLGAPIREAGRYVLAALVFVLMCVWALLARLSPRRFDPDWPFGDRWDKGA